MSEFCHVLAGLAGRKLKRILLDSLALVCKILLHNRTQKRLHTQELPGNIMPHLWKR